MLISTLPLPVPVPPDKTVMNDALLVAVHEQLLPVVVTFTVAVALVLLMLSVVGEIAKVHELGVRNVSVAE
jgi:hypothetical protein